MKIRTFLVCEDIDLDGKSIIIKKMMAGLVTKTIPAKESIVFLLTFDDVEKKEKTLEVVVYSNKDKEIKKIEHKMAPENNAAAFKMEIEFPIEDVYQIKLAYNGTYLGKYPFFVRKGVIQDES